MHRPPNENMHGYLYILSNPSMPGLIKIGRTTNLPSQRMAELHSTGVPTPFELEFCAEVDDCMMSERAAHAALAEHRVSSSREFFKTSVRHAIQSVLPVVGQYKIYEVRETHGIARLEEEQRRRRQEQERSQAEERARQERKREEERRAKVATVLPVVQAVNQAKAALSEKGPKPVEDSGSGFGTFLWFCFFPVPIGWLVWLGVLNVFDAKRQEYGLVCLGLVIAGYIVYKVRDGRSEEHRQRIAPWVELENEIFTRTQELRGMGLTLEEANALVGSSGQAKRLPAAATNAQPKTMTQVASGVAPQRPDPNRPLWVNIHGQPMNPFAPRDNSEDDDRR